MRVLVGYPEGPKRSIIIALENARERRLFVTAFLDQGWRVEPVRDIMEAGSIGRNVISPDVVLTDQPPLISALRSVHFQTCDIVALVDANEEAVERVVLSGGLGYHKTHRSQRSTGIRSRLSLTKAKKAEGQVRRPANS